MISAPVRRLSVFDLVEGFHLSAALAALEDTGILESLVHPIGSKELAFKHRVDADMLSPVLTYLAGRTDFIQQRGDVFVLTEAFGPEARFLMHQYLGAYGRSATGLATVLRQPALAPTLVDKPNHAKAFHQFRDSGSSVLTELIVGLELNHVLDLGCGTGALLVNLGKRQENFVGWGVDANPSMCEAASAAFTAAGIGDRVSVLEADCSNLSALRPELVEQVRVISAGNFLNSFFGKDGREAVEWLSEMRSVFSDRLLLVADYYGRVGKVPPPWPRHIALHDFVQVISGQGIPPVDFGTWNALYQEAGCTLAHVCEIDNSSAFIHVLKL